MMPEGCLRGVLTKGIGSFYTVQDEADRTYVIRCKKKFRRQGLTPLPGDQVWFTPGAGEEDGWLEEILPRKTLCLRPPVANVTCLVIVLAPVPEADLLLTDRLISRAYAQDMRVVLAVNKADLDPAFPVRISQAYERSGAAVCPVCAISGEGLDRLRLAMGKDLCCMTGQSGAGKSTLLNALLGLELETGEISAKISRGKNTTRRAELIRKDGIQVMDTAGFSLLDPERDLPPEKLKERYPEFAPYEGRCRFRECLHDREPGCAVETAVRNGELSRERVERYRELLTETRETWRERYD